MRKQVEESVATGAAAGRGRGGRFSAGRKRATVLRLLRGALATRRSQEIAISSPAPRQHPSTRAMTGTGVFRRAAQARCRLVM